MAGRVRMWTLRSWLVWGGGLVVLFFCFPAMGKLGLETQQQFGREAQTMLVKPLQDFIQCRSELGENVDLVSYVRWLAAPGAFARS